MRREEAHGLLHLESLHRLCCSTPHFTFQSASTRPRQFSFKAAEPCRESSTVKELLVIIYVILISKIVCLWQFVLFLVLLLKNWRLKTARLAQVGRCTLNKVTSDSYKQIFVGWLLCDYIVTASFSKYKCNILSWFYFNYIKASRREKRLVIELQEGEEGC